MSDLIPSDFPQVEETRIQDSGTGECVRVSIVDGQVTLKPEASLTTFPLGGLVQQAFEAGDAIFDEEMSKILSAKRRGELAIEERYKGAVGGNTRAARDKRKFIREKIDPMIKDLQQRQVGRVAKYGKFSDDLIMETVEIQVRQRMRIAELEGLEPIREIQGRHQLEDTQGEVARRRILDNHSNRQADIDQERLERLEKSRAENQVHVETSRSDAQERLARIGTEKEIAIAKLNRKSMKDQLKKSQKQEKQKWDREDRHRTEDASSKLVSEARAQVKLLPYFQAQSDMLNADGPEEVAKAASQLLTSFVTESTLLQNSPPDVQPQVAERLLNLGDKLFELFIGSKFGTK
jgi:hypothetical protein